MRGTKDDPLIEEDFPFVVAEPGEFWFKFEGMTEPMTLPGVPKGTILAVTLNEEKSSLPPVVWKPALILVVAGLIAISLTVAGMQWFYSGFFFGVVATLIAAAVYNKEKEKRIDRRMP